LDLYKADILAISNAYGQKFYEYHKLFSMQSANFLQLYGTKVDWSKRDRDMLQLIIGSAKSNYCTLCGEVSHKTEYCHLASDKPAPKTNQANTRTFSDGQTDMHGRRRIFHKGAELCNNYNSENGCKRQQCLMSHVCAGCKAPNHPIGKCLKQGAKSDKTEK
jgi:hypothetical protein